MVNENRFFHLSVNSKNVILKTPIVWALFCALLIIIALPLFSHLDVSPICQWDESRLAINAFLMHTSGDWIVTQFDGGPDMWSTKPPLMIWCQVLMMKVFGANELAVRLPAALAAVGTCLLVFWVFVRKYKNALLGFISVVVLITVPGYVVNHGTRTGDYDSLLTMLTTAYVIFFFLYLDEGGKKYLYITFICLTLATLTKGIQALIFLPALAIYAVYKKQVVATLKKKEFYIGVAGFVFFVVGYYLLREHYNPGYIKAVQENEIGGRYGTVIENHVGDVWYYYGQLVNTDFRPWYLLVIPGIVTGFMSKNKFIKNITIYTTILALEYLLLLSSAQTKIEWYLMPMYPLLSILVGIFLYTIVTIIENSINWQSVLSKNVLLAVFLFFVLIQPYTETIKRVFAEPDAYAEREQVALIDLFKEATENKKDIRGYGFLNVEQTQNVRWYLHVLNTPKETISLIFQRDIGRFSRVGAYRDEDKEYVAQHYNTEILDQVDNLTIYQIIGRKVSDTTIVK